MSVFDVSVSTSANLIFIERMTLTFSNKISGFEQDPKLRLEDEGAAVETGAADVADDEARH